MLDDLDWWQGIPIDLKVLGMRDCGMIIHKWDISITPFPLKVQGSLQKGSKGCKSQRLGMNAMKQASSGSDMAIACMNSEPLWYAV